MTNTDSPETIGTEWIKYESLHGDLDTFLNCQEKFKNKYINVTKIFIYLLEYFLFTLLLFIMHNVGTVVYSECFFGW